MPHGVMCIAESLVEGCPELGPTRNQPLKGLHAFVYVNDCAWVMLEDQKASLVALVLHCL